jgi:S-methylmethionine-dependent homocysteine/selenocysteine methylase
LVGILSFNLGLLELKQVPEKASAEDAGKAEAHRTAAIQWTSAAAELFGGCENKSLHGEALTVSTALSLSKSRQQL